MDTLSHLVETTLAQPVDPAFAVMASHIRDTHPGRIHAIIGYGSALRGTAAKDTLLDLYVLTPEFIDVSASIVSRTACRIAPPNVYYAEVPHAGATLRAKYAVMPLRQFRQRMGPDVSNPYFWARFSQPVRIIHVEDDHIRDDVVEILCIALRTMFANARALTTEDDPRAIFSQGFAATYATELRPEGKNRSRSIVEAEADYYQQAGRLLEGTKPLPANWPMRRLGGKTLSLMRLFKAAFTFRGGVDYAAWKISRHSGQSIEITDWNRRHPLLTGLMLLPQLLRRGALR